MTRQPRKIFLFALPRSGSTLLCDLLTIPGQSVMLHEPMMLRNFGDGRERRIASSLSQFGVDLGVDFDVDSARFKRGCPAKPWFDEEVIPRLESLDFWGVKEVYLTDAERLIDEYGPDRIILLWRDPKDVALSFLELMNRSLMSYADRQTLKDEAWAMECLTVSAEVLHRISGTHPHRLLRYEQLVHSDEHRQELLDYVQLAEFSDQRTAMVADEHGIRTPEVLRHGHELSANSIARWNTEPQGWRRSFAKVCHFRMRHYAEEAGYTLPREEVPLNATADATQNKTFVDRVFDPDYRPAPQFDFAYARRWARQQAAKLIPPSSVVLDVGGSTAALAFMTDAKVTVIDDGAAGKRVMSKPWREGVFPTLSEFDTVTFLFSLEYVDDPRRMIAAVLDRGLRVIVTYHCTDEIPSDLRRALDFKSHLSRSDWTQFAASVSKNFSFDWAFDQFQSSILLEPVQH